MAGNVIDGLGWSSSEIEKWLDQHPDDKVRTGTFEFGRGVLFGIGHPDEPALSRFLDQEIGIQVLNKRAWER
jgi:hypothetical protein